MTLSRKIISEAIQARMICYLVEHDQVESLKHQVFFCSHLSGILEEVANFSFEFEP